MDERDFSAWTALQWAARGAGLRPPNRLIRAAWFVGNRAGIRVTSVQIEGLGKGDLLRWAEREDGAPGTVPLLLLFPPLAGVDVFRE